MQREVVRGSGTREDPLYFEPLEYNECSICFEPMVPADCRALIVVNIRNVANTSSISFAWISGGINALHARFAVGSSVSIGS